MGPAVVVAKPEDSPILQLVQLSAHDEQTMPPKGPRLSADQIDWIKRWIAGGAPVK